jgi:hypothetical protein
MYLPFGVWIVQNHKLIEEKITNEQELQKWLLCFLFIIKNLRKRVLKQWWRKETQSGRDGFLQFIAFCFDKLAVKFFFHSDYFF